MSLLFPVISVKVFDVVLDQLKSSDKDNISWTFQPSDSEDVFRWMQKSEIANDFITQQKVWPTRRNTHVCLLIISKFVVFGSSDEDMKARNGKLQVTLSFLTTDITITMIKKTIAKNDTLFLQYKYEVHVTMDGVKK